MGEEMKKQKTYTYKQACDLAISQHKKLSDLFIKTSMGWVKIETI